MASFPAYQYKGDYGKFTGGEYGEGKPIWVSSRVDASGGLSVNGAGTIRFDISEWTKRMGTTKVRAALNREADRMVKEVVTWMQSHYAWEDRTGNASSGLRAFAVRASMNATNIRITHSAFYGVFLESPGQHNAGPYTFRVPDAGPRNWWLKGRRKGERNAAYPIIKPAVEYFSQHLEERLAKIFNESF